MILNSTISIQIHLYHFHLYQPSFIFFPSFLQKYWQTASQGINPQDHVIISRPSSAITSPSMFEDYLSQAFNFYSQRVSTICRSFLHLFLKILALSFNFGLLSSNYSNICNNQIVKSICGSGTLTMAAAAQVGKNSINPASP